MTHREPPWLCFSCGYQLDATTGVEDRAAVPTEGSISICLNCGHLYERSDGKWRTAPPGLIDQLAPETRRSIQMAQAARRVVITEDLSKRGGHT